MTTNDYLSLYLSISDETKIEMESLHFPSRLLSIPLPCHRGDNLKGEGGLSVACQLAEYVLDSDECKVVLEMDFVRSVDIDGLSLAREVGRREGYPGQWRVSVFRGIGHKILCRSSNVEIGCVIKTANQGTFDPALCQRSTWPRTALHCELRSIPGPLFVS